MNIVTKIFIVLTLVCSIILSVFVVVTLGGTRDYKVALDNANAGLRASNLLYELEAAKHADDNTRNMAQVNRLNDQLTALNKLQAELRISYGTLSSQLDAKTADYERQVNQASKLTSALTLAQAEISQKDPELTKLRKDAVDSAKSISDLNLALERAQSQLDQATRQIDRLKEQVADASKPAASNMGTVGNVTTLSVGVAAAVPVNGKVTNVMTGNGGVTYLELSLGARDNIVEGTRFVISRGDKYVGDAIVTKVAPDQSVAKVKEGNPLAVQVNDLVSSGPQ